MDASSNRVTCPKSMDAKRGSCANACVVQTCGNNFKVLRAHAVFFLCGFCGCGFCECLSVYVCVCVYLKRVPHSGMFALCVVIKRRPRWMANGAILSAIEVICMLCKCGRKFNACKYYDRPQNTLLAGIRFSSR